MEFTVAGIFDPDVQALAVLTPIAATTAASDNASSASAALVLASVLDGPDSGSRASWTILPDPASIAATQLAVLVSAVPRLRDIFAGDTQLGSGGVVLNDRLTPALEQIRAAVAAVSGIAPAAQILLMLLCSVAVGQSARLLVSVRTKESDLLRARGVSSGGGARLALTEAIPTALAGVIAGYVLALVGTPLLVRAEAALSGISGSAAGISVTARDILDPARGSAAWSGVANAASASWPVPIVVFLVCSAAMATAGIRDLLRSAQARRGADTTHTRRIVAAGALAILWAAAALSLWQLDFYGSPLATDAAGRLRVNVLAAAAPALATLACAAAILALSRAVFRVLERASSAARSLAVALSARQVARRLGSYAVPLVLIAVTAASGTLAGTYAQSYQDARHTASLLANGSSVEVSVGSGVVDGPKDISDLRPVRGLPAVKAVGEVYRVSMDAGGQPLDIVAAQSAQLPRLLAASASAQGQTMADALTPAMGPDRKPAGMDLPAGASALSLQITAGGTGAALVRDLDTTVWVDGTAGLVPLVLDRTPVPAGSASTTVLTAALPPSLGAQRIASIDFLLGPTQPRGAPGPGTSSIRLDRVGADVGGRKVDIVLPPAPLLLQNFSPTPGSAHLLIGANGREIVVDNMYGAEQRVRLAPTSTFGPAPAAGPAAGGASAAIPVLVTGPVLKALDLKVGQPLTLRPGGVTVEATIAGTLAAVPGTSAALAAMVDLRSFQRQEWQSGSSVVRPNALWV
ncbi:MAG TPA: hypothetical protein VIG41_08830, partial [Micrococcaceae bacterium]